MRTRQIIGPACLLLFGLACSGAQPPRSPATVTSEGPLIAPQELETTVTEETASAELAEKLEQVVAGDAGWDHLRIDIGCLGDSGFRSLTIYGSGVGIWDEESQFELSPAEILAALDTFRRFDFAAMRPSYGGKNDPAPIPGDDAAAAIRVTCYVSLDLDGASKRVSQLFGGRQSRELREMVDELFAGCRERAAAGVTATDLEDGLDKISRLELAPEALAILVHRKAEPGSQASVDPGWLLRVEGLKAVTRPYLTTQGLGEPVELLLGRDRLGEIAQALAQGRLAGLPANLWAEQYTDLTVKVLNHEVNVQARGFAGMTPTTHGERQRDFDQIFAVLEGLHQQVLAEGSAAG